MVIRPLSVAIVPRGLTAVAAAWPARTNIGQTSSARRSQCSHGNKRAAVAMTRPHTIDPMMSIRWWCGQG